MPSTQPNLFSFATSELSQDAFIAWLLAWADSDHEATHPDLHALGLRLLRELARTPGKRFPSRPRVEVRRQDQKIDVAVLVNDDLVVVIEDKTDSGRHSNQLVRYQQVAGKAWGKRRPVCVYLKTGEESSATTLPSGWRPFMRRDFLKVLRTGAKIQNAILRDFTAHLETIERDVQAYRTLPIGCWKNRPARREDRRVWQGFFAELQRRLGEGDWGYVANPNGGFMGFWWGTRKVDGTAIYLQLEESKLQVKIGVGDMPRDQRATERSRWLNAMVNGPGKARFRRPPRLGSGATMTVGVSVMGDYREVDENDVVKIDATVKLLKAAMRHLHDCVDAAPGR